MPAWSNQQIAYSYRTAKFPNEQIGILAELNDVAPSEIISILLSEGCTVARKLRTKERKAERVHNPDKRYGWTAEEKAQLLQLLKAGVPGAEIMELTKRTRQTLQRLVREFRKEGEDVSISFDHQGKTWSDEEVRKLKALVDDGLNNSEISLQFPHRSYYSIAAKINSLRAKGAW